MPLHRTRSSAATAVPTPAGFAPEAPVAALAPDRRTERRPAADAHPTDTHQTDRDQQTARRHRGEKEVSAMTLAPPSPAPEPPAETLATTPCREHDPELWFAESPADVERAKALCLDCPLREACLSTALDRREPWGVWGGELLVGGDIVARKRPRGRPRKHPVAA